MLFPVIIRTSALFCRLPIWMLSGIKAGWYRLVCSLGLVMRTGGTPNKLLLYFTYLVVYSIKMTRRITVMIENCDST